MCHFYKAYWLYVKDFLKAKKLFGTLNVAILEFSKDLISLSLRLERKLLNSVTTRGYQMTTND
jgi:hypothetical protein